MELITNIWGNISQHIDPMVVLLVLMGGFFAKRYMAELNINNAVKTLLVGTVFTAVYLLILHMSGGLQKADYTKYFVSYCVATSLYEILIKKLMDLLKQKKEN